MRITFLCVSCILVLNIYSQNNEVDSILYAVTPIGNLSSDNDVMTSYADNKMLICQSPLVTDYITNWNPRNSNQIINTQYLYKNPYFKSLTSASLKFPLDNNETLGTVSYSRMDSSYVYCSINNGTYSISYLKNNTKKIILSGTKKEQYIHPFITDDGSRIFFSSNKGNNKNDYNLFFINRINEEWSTPIELHSDINTKNDEVFPTWYNDTLYYSSNASGDLDLYYSPKKSQYNSSQKLESPFNSKSDDFFLHKLNAGMTIITSDRNSSMDRPLLIKKQIKKNQKKTTLQGFIACSGNRLSNIPIRLTTYYGDELDRDVSDTQGNFIFKTYKSIKKYKIKLDKNDPRTKDCAEIYFTDEEGNVIQKILLNDEGIFKFELLDTDKIANLDLIPLQDESLLKINIEGQVFENTPGDIGQGKPIKIVDENNDLLALAFTKEDGSFQFQDLSPNQTYKFNFDEIEKELQLLVKKNGENILVPVQGKNATYQRIEPENALELMDENGSKITIETSEYFEISLILYEFSSSKLSESAKIQLDKLAKFIFNNDKITIELTSHTDSRGPAEFNTELSQKRVNSAIDYLVNMGVERNRLQGYGMGEKKPLNKCADGIECTEEEHALNRRTEIRIIAQ